MKTVLLPLLATLARLFRSRALLHLEILALRQQLATLAARDCGRPRIRHHERLFWIWLYRIWPGCVDTLALVKPDTLVRWHRQGFRRYWTRKSRCGRSGRPSVSPEIRALIRRLSRENPLYVKRMNMWRDATSPPPRFEVGGIWAATATGYFT